MEIEKSVIAIDDIVLSDQIRIYTKRNFCRRKIKKSKKFPRQLITSGILLSEKKYSKCVALERFYVFGPVNFCIQVFYSFHQNKLQIKKVTIKTAFTFFSLF